MKMSTWRLALAVSAISMLAAPRALGVTGEQQAKPKPLAATAHLVAADELKWNDVEGAAGVKMAVLNGDPAKGPSHFFLKFPGGFKADMHFHNADHWGTVVMGTILLTPDGGTEKRLPPGSGFSFMGKKRHSTKCDEGTDCVIFVDSRAKWDVVPVEKK